MIIVPHQKPRHPTRYLRPRYRYGGYGIWSIGKKVVKDSAQKIINNIGTKKILQKAGEALISGTTSSVKKAVEKTFVGKHNFKVTKELLDQLPTASGSGIVYD